MEWTWLLSICFPNHSQKLRLKQYAVPNQWFMLHSHIPTLLITDQGTKFTSNLINHFLTLLEFRPEEATLKQLQTLGVAIKSHGALKRSLRINEKQMQHNWLIYINLADFQYNKSNHSTIGCPPRLVFYGRKP